MRKKIIILWLLVYGLTLFAPNSILYAQKKNKNKTKNENKIKEKEANSNGTTQSKNEQIDFYFYEGLTKKALNDYKGSISMFMEVLKLDPKHHASLYNIGEMLFEMNNYSEAETYLAKAVQYDNKNVWYLRLLALAYEKNQKLEDAIQIIEKNLNNFPNEMELRLQLAEIYIRNTQYRKAIALYDTVENYTGVNEEISVQKQRIYLLLNEPEKAIQEIQKLISIFPYEPKHYFNLYELYLKTNQNELAIQTLEKLLTINPEETLTLFKIADYYKSQKNDEKEMFYLKKAFTNPNISIEIKTEYLMERMNQDTSIQNKKKVLELASYIQDAKGNESILFALKGDIAFSSQQMDSARYYYKKAVEANDQNQLLWNKILELDTRLENLEWLLEDAKNAVEFFPNEPVFIYYLGFANYELKNYKNAIKNFEKLIKLIDSSEDEMITEVYQLLANAYHFDKNYKKSDEIFEKLLKYEPDNPITLNNYAYYLAERNENLDKARQMIERVIKTNPDEPSFQDTYGWVLFKLKRYDEALIWIEKAYKSKKSADICEHLGDVYFMKGNKTKALEFWNEAKKLGSKSEELEKKIQNGSL
jgi:tetratricopeptide (TPR) repeat protein